jgi:hypothetical protein
MADYLVGKKTLGKNNEIYEKNWRAQFATSKHSKSSRSQFATLNTQLAILSFQVFKGKPLRRGGGGRPGEAICDWILRRFTPQDDDAGKPGLKTGGNFPHLHLKMSL